MDILVGTKPPMTYVLPIVSEQGDNDFTVKGRGRAIKTVVDVIEILKARHITDLKVNEIRIGTDQFMQKTDDGERKRNVSTIEIDITK